MTSCGTVSAGACRAEKNISPSTSISELPCNRPSHNKTEGWLEDPLSMEVLMENLL
jgi:hypothetical protein